MDPILMWSGRAGTPEPNLARRSTGRPETLRLPGTQLSQGRMARPDFEKVIPPPNRRSFLYFMKFARTQNNSQKFNEISHGLGKHIGTCTNPEELAETTGTPKESAETQ